MVAIRPVSLAILMLALLPAGAAANTGSEILVEREPGLSAAERRDIRADAGVRLVETLSVPRVEVVAAPSGEVDDALRALEADPDVVMAAPNRRVHALSDDPFFDRQWGLENTGQAPFGGTFDADMEVPPGWDLVPAAGPTVAVIDSGVFAAHRDLNGATAEPDDPVAPGYDWVDDDADANDELPAARPQDGGHGTHVAGTIVAQRDNELGIAGVAPDARVLPLRALDENGDGLLSDIIDAFHYADEQGVRVVNASFGAQGANEFEEAAIEAADDTLFVVAAGNEGFDNDGPSASFPCAYDLPNILCVGASDFNDAKPSFSNFGADSVDVFAPGVAILSTVPDLPALPSRYGYKDGTSMSAPHVAGLAALMLARDPSLSVDDLKADIMGTVDPVPAFSAISVSGGRVDAERALLAVAEDRDGDGFTDDVDTCPDVPDPAQDGEACDADAPPADSDGDTVPDAEDICDFEPNPESSIGCPGTSEDGDGDGVTDAVDNCPADANSDQADNDVDGAGDVCDPDDDNDGDADGADNCQTVPNPSQVDTDNDGAGDTCDGDDDNDGRLDGADNCRTVVNPDQANRDGDAFGDACDGDVDGDGYGNGADNCPTVSNSGQGDADGDRIGDSCDATPRGDDPDGDGKPWIDDLCPTVPGALANGCPAPPVAAPQLAQITRVSAKVSKRGGRRSAKLTVSTTGPATVRITVERKRGRRWVRVTRKTRVASGTRATLRVSRLKRGSYRARISISSGGGAGKSVSKTFRVR